MSAHRLILFNRDQYTNDTINFFTACQARAVTLANATIAAVDRFSRNLLGQYNPSFSTVNIRGKAKAIYLVIGGTSACHTLNFLDPRDDSSAKPLVFVGSPTHNSNGVSWAVNSYARTSINDNEFTKNSTSMGYYSGSVGSFSTMGVFNNGGNSHFLTCDHVTVGARYCAYTVGTAEAQAVKGHNTTGFFLGTRNSANDSRLYRNGAVLASSVANVAGDVQNRVHYLNAVNTASGVPDSVGTQPCRFAWWGSGLTAAESVALSNYVAELQTALGRAV